MEKIVFKSADVAKGGFIVFCDDRLVAVKLTKDFVKETNKILKQNYKEKNKSTLAMLMYTEDSEYWVAFPDNFLNMEPWEIVEKYPDATLLEYSEIRKFKLSSSTGSIFDEGVQTIYPGELLIKGNGKKIAMDHKYDSDDPVYQRVVDLKKQLF